LTEPDSRSRARRGEGSRPRAARNSLFAITAPVASAAGLVPLCLPLCLIGPILGAIGLVQVRKHGYGGKRAAIAGIVIGLVVGAGWAAVGIWWNANVRTPMIEGPYVALDAGFRGDIAAFKGQFHGAGATASDAEARAFLDALRGRYGGLQAIEPAPGDLPPADPDRVNMRRPVVPYAIRFTGGIVRADAQFVVFAGGFPPEIVLRWGWIVIRDDRLGDLEYPLAGSKSVPWTESADAGEAGRESDDDDDAER
jgi:hypothetical protein